MTVQLADSLHSVFNVQGSEIIILLLLALIVLGPEKLPEAVRRFSQFYAEAKKMSTGFQTELRNALDEPMRELQATADLVRQQADLRDLTTPTAKPAAATTAPSASSKEPKSEMGDAASVANTGLPEIAKAPVIGGARPKTTAPDLAPPETDPAPGSWPAPDASAAADPAHAPESPDRDAHDRDAHDRDAHDPGVT